MGEVAAQERGTSSSRYAILGRLASGGMADIYLVHATTDAGVGRYLVLKRVLAERSRDEQFTRMFLDEAHLAAQLQHPNIAQVYDVGKLDGAYFFTMEYVHGENVRSLLHKLVLQKRQLPVNLALYIASNALSALHHAHERTTPDGKPLDIVHRDVSPTNVMVSLEGSVKLLDFGVAKASERSAESNAGSIKGKVAYMSPEQCSSTTLDRRSDVFALGIVLYEMLIRKRLFNRDTDFNTMLAITQEDVPPPSTKRHDLSPEIDRIVMTALARDRDKRYPSAAAMIEDIENVATAERHSLSGAAMGRFMREMFGDKPEPWKKLPTPDTSNPKTVTINVFGQSKTLGGVGPAPPTALQAELDHAPDLFQRGRAETPIDWAYAGTPASASSISSVGRKRRRGVIVLGAGLAVLAAGAAAVVMTRGSSKSPSPPVQQPVATATLDAAVHVTVVPDAAPIAEVVVDARPAPSLADEAAAGNWGTALAICGDTPPQADRDKALCAIAACNRSRRDLAVELYATVTAEHKPAIEAACKKAGIPLAAPKQAKKDPCKDPAFVDKNPMLCQ